MILLQSKETEKKFKDTDKKFQDTDRKFQEYQKQMRKIETKFYSQWGRFVESLVEVTVLKLLQDKGIRVERTLLREKAFYKNRQFEIDIIAKNGLEVVAVEVKTTLNPEDVKEFIEELKLFKGVFPEYADKKLYGAVAYIGKEGDADKFAESKGLFVIKSTNDSARITNKKTFVPKVW